MQACKHIPFGLKQVMLSLFWPILYMQDQSMKPMFKHEIHFKFRSPIYCSHMISILMTNHLNSPKHVIQMYIILSLFGLVNVHSIHTDSRTFDRLCFPERRTAYSVFMNLVSIGSGDDLLHYDTKSLPQPMLTNHQWGLVALTWGQFHRKSFRYLSLRWV